MIPSDLTELPLGETSKSRRDAAAASSMSALASKHVPVLVWAWGSPTITTWASFFVRAAGSLVVLPFALRQLFPAEIVFWQLLISIQALAFTLDLGLTVTFTRYFAYAAGGAKELGSVIRGDRESEVMTSEPNWPLVERLWGTVWWVYAGIAAVALGAIVIVGTLCVRPVILEMPSVGKGWVIWWIFASFAPVGIVTLAYSAYLQGMNQVAIQRRWEAVCNLGMIFTNLAVLYFNGALLGLVIGAQAWAVIGLLRSRQVARYVAGARLAAFAPMRADRVLLGSILPVAWRSGLGVICSGLAIQGSGILLAWLAGPGQQAVVAGYLVALRIMSAISQFSQAPFASKLPKLAQLRAGSRREEFLALAGRGERGTYWVFVLSVSLAGAGLPVLFGLVGSNVAFAPTQFWWLLSVAFFAERFGAMHLQLYSTSNHIVWHIANGVVALVMALAIAGFWPMLRFNAVPLGLLLAYGGFYAWYCARLSYQDLRLRPWAWERKTSFFPAMVLLVLGALHLAFLGA